MSSEKKASRPVSRRTLVGAAVWATPVVAVIAATPAHAVGSPVTREAVTNAQVPSVGNGNTRGLLQLNYAAIKYDWSAWGKQWGDVPTQAIVDWSVVVKNSAGEVVHTFKDAKSLTISRSEHIRADGFAYNLPAGTYTVVSQITSVVYSPATVSGVTFYTAPSSSSATIQVL